MAQTAFDSSSSELQQSGGGLIVASAQPGPDGFSSQVPSTGVPLAYQTGAGASKADDNSRSYSPEEQGNKLTRRGATAPG